MARRFRLTGEKGFFLPHKFAETRRQMQGTTDSAVMCSIYSAMGAANTRSWGWLTLTRWAGCAADERTAAIQPQKDPLSPRMIASPRFGQVTFDFRSAP
jgi:hypothetical protein